VKFFENTEGYINAN